MLLALCAQAAAARSHWIGEWGTKGAAQAPHSGLKRQMKTYNWAKLVKSRAFEKNKQNRPLSLVGLRCVRWERVLKALCPCSRAEIPCRAEQLCHYWPPRRCRAGWHYTAGLQGFLHGCLVQVSNLSRPKRFSSCVI